MAFGVVSIIGTPTCDYNLYLSDLLFFFSYESPMEKLKHQDNSSKLLVSWKLRLVNNTKWNTLSSKSRFYLIYYPSVFSCLGLLSATFFQSSPWYRVIKDVLTRQLTRPQLSLLLNCWSISNKTNKKVAYSPPPPVLSRVSVLHVRILHIHNWAPQCCLHAHLQRY